MKKMSIVNYQGGSGKTSLVVNIAHGLALSGARVLVIDTDFNASVSAYFGAYSDVGLYDVLCKGREVRDCVVSARKNVDVLSGGEKLYAASFWLSKQSEREFQLRNRLKTLEGYDLVLVDCAGGMNLLSQNALVFSGDVLVPVSMAYSSFLGVRQLLKNIRIINRLFKESVVVRRVVPTFFDDRDKQSQDVLESLKRVFPGYVCTPLRSSRLVAESAGFKQSIFEYDMESEVAKDYQTVIKEVFYGQAN